MNKFVVAALFLSVPSLFAGTVICQSDVEVIPCTSDIPVGGVAEASITRSPGQVSMRLPVDLFAQESQKAYQVYGEADATVGLLPAPIGDVLKIEGVLGSYGNVGGQMSLFGVSLPADYPVCAYHGCYINVSVPVTRDLPLVADISGGGYAYTVYAGPYPENYVLGTFTATLFKSDGVTPDVFTPEPSIYALTGIGMGCLLLLRRRPKARR